jgi:hypothetical protein
MSITSTSPKTAQPGIHLADDLVWGAEAIGTVLGINRERVYYLIKTKAIPAAYCRAIELERHAALQLATDGYLTADNRPSPWLAIMAQATKSMLALSTRLKLTPQSRSHSAPARLERPLSAYEKLALMESGSDETA